LEYEHLIESKEAADLTQEEYGDILHNLAVAKVQINGLKEASDIFLRAYEQNQREESLKQYLFSVKLSSNPKIFEEIIQKFQINQELLQRISSEVDQMQYEAKQSAMMSEINQLKALKISGKINEFYGKADELIDSWKAMIRQM
jgi:hypothetical protein